jgi:hypothetical protein
MKIVSAKIVKLLILLLLFLVISSKLNITSATYDPLSVANNKFGIHILFPEELSDAAKLVNSSGGDWGYVTIPIKASDKNIDKWQKFMDDCKISHVIPIIRLATDGDFFTQGSWSVPDDGDIMDFANFLNSLSWPTQNRYVVIYNEPNRADEWGGAPDASEYAEILDYAATEFKSVNPDFYIISAGLDNASINDPKGQAINEFTYMRQMNDAVPGIFSEIDGLGSHSYPNPGFSAPPSELKEGVYSFYYQNQLIYSLTGKTLPVFITETGWSVDSVSYDTQASYYKQTLSDYWNDDNIVAITPFVFNAGEPFTQFSFLKNGNQTSVYDAYENFPKVKGQPLLTKDFAVYVQDQTQLVPVKKFKANETIKTIFIGINKSAKTFFKWILKD